MDIHLGLISPKQHLPRLCIKLDRTKNSNDPENKLAYFILTHKTSYPGQRIRGLLCSFLDKLIFDICYCFIVCL